MTTLKTGVLFLLVSSALYSCKQKSFTKLPSGIEYMMLHDAKGDKKASEGSVISMHIITMAGDSTLFDSRKMNNNEPVPAQITKPQYNGDIMEGFALLTEGDSAHFRISADSIFRQGQMPPFVKKGDTIHFLVKMVSIKSKEEYEKEQAANAQKQGGVDDAAINQYLKEKNINATKTTSGMYYVITRPGSGENAKPGQEVSMNYTGKLMDGTVFDSNQDPKFGHSEAFKFQLGTGQVIKGWDEGIALMNKGAKATFFIPSPLGYGDRAMPGNPNNAKGIPANSVLIFDVEMLGAKDAPQEAMESAPPTR